MTSALWSQSQVIWSRTTVFVLKGFITHKKKQEKDGGKNAHTHLV